MKRTKNNLGFTLLELLLAVAILGILLALGFVAVAQYQRNLKLNEMDGIAKELLHASQNQLSKAKENGILETLIGYQSSDDVRSKLGVPAGDEKGNEYYIVFTGPGDSNVTGKDAWEVILPFGSIDETVRRGGSYLIRYNVKTGQVLQTYYKEVSGSNSGRFGADLDITEEIKEGIRDKSIRKNYQGRNIIGFAEAEGDSALADIQRITKPEIHVENNEVLYAEASISDDLTALLCVRGLSSYAIWTFPLNKTQVVNGKKRWVLDDITDKELHFVNVMERSKTVDEGNVFIPGEDIEVYITAQKKEGLSEVVESDHIITNSLFGSITPSDSTGEYTANVSYFRHLENLSKEMSCVNTVTVSGEGKENVSVVKAEQVQDMDWNEFLKNDDLANNSIVDYSESGPIVYFDNYYPVGINDETFKQYDGKNCYIENVEVYSSTLDAGLFGKISNSDFVICNLELRDFSVTSQGNTGALVGLSEGNLQVENIVVYNPSELSGASISDEIIQSTAGSAGGLIGAMSTGKVKNCGAAVYVQGKTNAGGLIGYIGSGDSEEIEIMNSYSGGHTSGGVFVNKADAANTAKFNVICSDGNAGGLIGTAGNASVSYCYSTSSVTGKKVNPIFGDKEIQYFVQDQKSPGDNNSPYYICTGDNNVYGIGWLQESGTNTVLYPFFDSSSAETNGLLNIDTSKRSSLNKFNYDAYWNEDVFMAKTINELNNGTITDIDGEPVSIWFLQNHVGDWAYPDYTAHLIND